MINRKKDPNNNVIDINGNLELVMRLASDKLDAEDLIGALSLMRRAETMEPENEEVLLAIAGTYNEMNRFTEALAYSARVMNSGHEYVQDSFMIAGYSYLGLGEYVAARKAFMCFLMNVPDGYTDEDMIALYEALDVCEANCAADNAKEPVPAVRDSSEVELEETLNRIREEEGREDGDLAYGLLREAVEKFPNSYELFEKYLLSCYAVMHYGEGVKQYEDAPEKWKSQFVPRCYAAMLYNGAGMPQKKAECVESILEMKGLDDDETMRASAVMLEIGNAADALTLIKKVYPEHPYDQSVIHNYAAAAYLCGNYALAQSLYERELRIDPTDCVAAYYRRLCIETAESGVQKSISIPYDVPAGELFRCMSVISAALEEKKADGAKENDGKPENDKPENGKSENAKFDERDFEDSVRYCATMSPMPLRMAGLMLLYDTDERAALHELFKILLDPDCDAAIRRFAVVMLREKANITRFTLYEDGKLLTGELQAVNAKYGGADDGEEFDVRYLPAAFRRMYALLTKNLKHCDGAVMSSVEYILDAISQWYDNMGQTLPTAQVPAIAAVVEYTCRYLNGERDISAAKLIKNYGITLRRFRNAFLKFEIDFFICCKKLCSEEEMHALGESIENAIDALSAEQKVTAKKEPAKAKKNADKACGKTKANPASNPGGRRGAGKKTLEKPDGEPVNKLDGNDGSAPNGNDGSVPDEE